MSTKNDVSRNRVVSEIWNLASRDRWSGDRIVIRYAICVSLVRNKRCRWDLYEQKGGPLIDSVTLDVSHAESQRISYEVGNDILNLLHFERRRAPMLA